MNFMQKCKRNGGFTLVELIVVIAILAILAGVAVPAYTGYIKKAEEAADQQIIGALNTALAAACLENNLDLNTVTAANIALTGEDGERTFPEGNNLISGMKSTAITLSTVPATGNDVPAAKLAKINEAFLRYFTDRDAVFGAIYHLNYDALTHSFDGMTKEEYDEAVENGEISASTTNWNNFFSGLNVSTQVGAVNNSIFGTIGAQGLMDKVDTVTGLAASLAEADKSGRFYGVLVNNMDDLAKAMGFEGEDDDAFWAKYNQMKADKVAELGITEDQADYQILSNFAVLAAAKNTTGTSTELLADLQSGITVSDVKALMANDASYEQKQEGLSKAAMMYAMYTAYANGLPEGDDKNAALNNANSVEGFLANMEDPKFQAYLSDSNSTAKTDLEGYLGALEIINQSADKDSGAVTDLVMNGFTDGNLVSALDSLLGK